MKTTNPSLLQRVRNKTDASSWREFEQLYAPLLRQYAKMRGLKSADADDVVQECMQALVRRMPQFEYRRSRGGFKAYLWRLANNKIIDTYRHRKPYQLRSGELLQLAQPDSESQTAWDRTWLRQHLRYCLKRVQTQFAPETTAAFKYYVIDEWPVEKVCRMLGVSANQVYLAKSRVTRRLRREMTNLIGNVA